MENNYDFLFYKINELEKKLFDIERRISFIEKNQNYDGDDESELITESSNSRKERFLFNGNSYKKNRLVLAVVKYFVQLQPNITAEELKNAFPSYKFKLRSTFNCVEYLDAIPEWQKEGVKRYFIKNDEVITLKDGTKMAVCTQWGPNIKYFIAYVKKYGFEIEKI